MARHVWGYWDCPTCGNKHIRGDKKFCTNCGAPIPDNTKYYMDPNAVEYVSESEKKYGANWICDYCNTQNSNDDLYCGNCGSPKGDAAKNYFGKQEEFTVKQASDEWECAYCGQKNLPEAAFCQECGAAKPGGAQAPNIRQQPTEKSGQEKKGKRQKKLWDCRYCTKKSLRNTYKYCPRCGEPKPEDTPYYEPTGNEAKFDKHWVCSKCHANVPDDPETKYCPYCSTPKPRSAKSVSNKQKNKDSFLKQLLKAQKKLILFVLFWAVVFFILTPVTRTAKVTGFEWERTVGIEEFKNVDESDWELPSNANLHEKKKEIKSYRKVLDHYETKTEKVSREVQDGYDTHYRDLGNGQYEEVRTPRYKTVYETKTYKEPVYRDEPVYATKYYYDIDKWVEVRTLDTNGNDQKPIWADPTEFVTYDGESTPQYGDLREGSKRGTYYIIITDKWGDEQKAKVDYEKWKEAKIGDKHTYKTKRFSRKPLPE